MSRAQQDGYDVVVAADLLLWTLRDQRRLSVARLAPRLWQILRGLPGHEHPIEALVDQRMNELSDVTKAFKLRYCRHETGRRLTLKDLEDDE